MKFSGEIAVGAARDAVFAKLQDIHFFASCIAGVRELTPRDDKCFDAVLETKVAYMTFKFKVTVELTEVTPPEVIAAKIEGAPMGLVGRLTATSSTAALIRCSISARSAERTAATRLAFQRTMVAVVPALATNVLLH